MACQDRRSSKGLVTNYGEGGATKREEGGGLQNGSGRGGGGHVKFHPYKKQGAEKV